LKMSNWPGRTPGMPSSMVKDPGSDMVAICMGGVDCEGC
jgi:hypothetical protein